MIYVVRLSEWLEKQIRKGQIPLVIQRKLYGWIDAVKYDGLERVRRIPGFHDEPCHGQMSGYRSIRLNSGWRAYYRVFVNEVEFVLVEKVDKHEY